MQVNHRLRPDSKRGGFGGTQQSIYFSKKHLLAGCQCHIKGNSMKHNITRALVVAAILSAAYAGYANGYREGIAGEIPILPIYMTQETSNEI